MSFLSPFAVLGPSFTDSDNSSATYQSNDAKTIYFGSTDSSDVPASLVQNSTLNSSDNNEGQPSPLLGLEPAARPRPEVDDMVEIGSPYLAENHSHHHHHNKKKKGTGTTKLLSEPEEEWLFRYWGRRLLSRIPQQSWRRRRYRHPRTDTRVGRILLKLKLYRLEIIGTILIVTGLAIVIASLIRPDVFSFTGGNKKEQQEPSNSSLRPPSLSPPAYGGIIDHMAGTPVSTPTGTWDQLGGHIVPTAAPPIVIAPPSAPAPTPVPMPITNSNNAKPLQPPTPSPTKSPKNIAMIDILRDISPTHQLEDDDTPQGMAYQWILNMDDLELWTTLQQHQQQQRYRNDNKYDVENDDNDEETNRIQLIHQRIQQRYILATFYFATGGRRATTTWSICGAVPDTSNSISSINAMNSISARCVYENGISICADKDSYIYCDPSLGPQQPIQYNTNENDIPRPPPRGGEDDDGTDIELDDLAAITASNLELDDLPALSSSSSSSRQSENSNTNQGQVHVTRNNDNMEKRWLSPVSECLWYGVTCTTDGQETVTSIILPRNGLTGNLIPELASLRRLLQLDLSHNALVGELPNEWGATMNQLMQLSLSHNEVKGSIPSSWVYGMTSLHTFNVEYNQFTGTLPSLAIPNWSQNMKQLLLSHNQFEGEFPVNLGRLQQLEWLDVSYNDWSGTLPSTLGNLQQLQHLNISECTKLKGSLPREIQSMKKLVELDVKGIGLRGNVPAGLWELTQLEYLQLGYNKFSGTLPNTLGQLTRLRELHLPKSGLEGTIPSTLGALERIQVVQLQFNDFDGDIPESICEVSTLFELQADCDRGGKVDCSCCTSCCSKKPRDKCKAQ